MRCLLAILVLTACFTAGAAGDEAPGAGPLVKLLQGGKLPPERQPPVVGLVCQRGTADELAVVVGLLGKPDTPPAVRRAALEGLLEAALTRKVTPSGDRSPLAAALADRKADDASRLLAVRLAGAWKESRAEGALAEIATGKATGAELRGAALEALVRLGGKEGRLAVEKLAGADQPVATRMQAVTALARLDAKAAADRAAAVLAASTGGDDPAALLAVFLETRGGSDLLAAALGKVKLPADPAKLALRGLYAAGRSDEGLVKVLSDAAGVASAAKPLSKKEVDELVEEARSKGDPVRGEKVFRRADLSCTRCHSMAGAGGGVGPELQAVGSTAQPDYVLRSILYPDESIKEEYLTVVVTTSDGKQYQGIVTEDSPAKLVLKDATGEIKTISKADIEERQKGNSLMPKGLAGLMTRAELVDVVRFLSELGKPGSKYPLQMAPVLRRWRVLGGPSDALVKDVPDELAFKEQVLGADRSRWSPAYSVHAGALPLAELPGVKAAGVAYAQAEVEVKVAGKVGLNLDSEAGLTVWVGENLQAATKKLTLDLEAGRHKITFRVDLAKRGGGELRAELVKEEGSEAEFSPVGGP